MPLLPTPSDQELRVVLEAGFVLRDVMRYDEAKAVFQGVAALRPDLELPPLALASVLIRQGDLARAQELCESVLARRPDSLHARVQHGEILLYRGRREEGEEILRSVVADGGDSPHAVTAQALLDTVAALAES
ncbi:MAG: tetratricopeptide repeat protein [Chloracidobacterium sp.]|nr:tetratricopeptide repeat protein [Chloracidobacterium sp.]MDW8216886.1 tetratricopeptide repeat protein [Acidobacteriota bacterium]